MKKSLFLMLLMILSTQALSTQVFAGTRRVENNYYYGIANASNLKARDEACYPAAGNPNSAYKGGWNFKYKVDVMQPVIAGPDGRHASVNFLHDADGNLIPNPLHNPGFPSYDPKAFNACSDAFLASH